MANCSLLLLTSSKKLFRFIRFIVEGGFVNQLRRFISSGSRFKGAASSITIVSSTPLYSSNAHCTIIIIVIIMIRLATDEASLFVNMNEAMAAIMMMAGWRMHCHVIIAIVYEDETHVKNVRTFPEHK